MRMTDVLRLSATLGAMTLLNGCLWQGYVSPNPSTMVAIAPACPALGVQNLSPEQTAILVEAVTEACKVVHSDLFLTRMSGRALRERCIDDAMVDGASVVQSLRTDLPDFSVIVRRPYGAVAQTHGVKQRMAIRPNRVNKWRGDENSKSQLVGTLVHEWTHMFIKADGYPRFQDDGNSTEESHGCFRGVLVSYETGETAISVYKDL